VDPALAHTDISRILTEGLQIDYSIICPQSIDTLDIDVRFFTGFQLQTNKVTLLDSEGNEVFFKVGTPIIHHFTYTRGKQIEITDTDHDGLSDEEERAYLTDINRADTDDDFYTDTEEVMHGWDPRNPAVSPGQIRRDAPVPVSMRPDSSIAQVANTVSPSVPSTTHTLSS
jgi:hypothetical protein